MMNTHADARSAPLSVMLVKGKCLRSLHMEVQKKVDGAVKGREQSWLHRRAAEDFTLSKSYCANVQDHLFALCFLVQDAWPTSHMRAILSLGIRGLWIHRTRCTNAGI